MMKRYMKGVDVLGADAVTKVTTARATTLYTSSDATLGTAWGAGKVLYASDEVKNGRRRVNMNIGGTDYWVPAADVITPFPQAGQAPLIDIKKGSDAPTGFTITDQPSTAATASDVRETYKVEKFVAPGAQKNVSEKAKPPIWPLLVTGGVGVVGLGTTIYLAAKSRWGWALANFFLFTPAAVVTVAGATLAIAKTSPVPASKSASTGWIV